MGAKSGAVPCSFEAIAANIVRGRNLIRDTWQTFCLAKKRPLKLLIIKAEVVELADTPSTRIALAILYKLLIINLLPFASITSGNAPRNGQ